MIERKLSVAELNAADIADEILDAVRDAVSRGEDGITFKEAVHITGLSYHHTYSAVNILAVNGRVCLASRADSSTIRIALPNWTAPVRLDLTAKQAAAMDYLVSLMDDDGIAYTSFAEIAASSNVPIGGISACLDALDKKGFLSILLRGKGARRTTFRVYPDGDGPRGYSTFTGMIPAPEHIGIPMPSSFIEWADGKSVADGVSRYDRSAPVIKRWFAEAGIEPVKPVRAKKPAKPKKPRAASDPVLVYPFLLRDRGTPEHILMRKVSDVVPKWLPPDRRADICQDMIVAILCGDLDEATLDLSAKEFTKAVLKQHPTMFGDLSLDAPIGDSDWTIMDTLSTEDSIWNRV